MSKALVLTGAGLNCERESAAALHVVGFDAEIIHIIDLIDAPEKLDSAQMLLFSGGFSYGDHMGSAFVLGEQIRRIHDAMQRFVMRDTLTLGICNGCQLLLRLDMFAGAKWGSRANAGGHYECRWVNVKAARDTGFTRKGEVIAIPVAHGEGRLFGGDYGEIALQYCDEAGELPGGTYPVNPNGAEADTAAVTAYNGRVMAMMPHPERGFWNWQRPDAASLRDAAKRSGEAFEGDGLAPAASIFANAMRYFG